MKKSGKITLFIIIGVAVALVCFNMVSIRFPRIALDQAKPIMEQAKNAYDKQDYELAISNYTRANKILFLDKHTKASNLLWRGRAYYYKKDYNQALIDFTNAIELQPKSYPSYNWRARTYVELQNYKLAIVDFSKSNELDGGNNWRTILERADIYMKIDDYPSALNDFKYVISIIDKNINSGDFSRTIIDEMNSEREIITSKIRRIEWLQNNPGKDYLEWMIINILTGE